VRNFSDHRGGGGRGGSRFGGRGGGGGDRQMHQATCASCGRDCRVPFRPTGDKPVYCSNCFEKRGGNENRRFSGRDDRSDRAPQRSGPDYQAQFDAVNQKLDTVLELLTKTQKPAKKKPKKEKPVVPEVEEVKHS